MLPYVPSELFGHRSSRVMHFNCAAYVSYAWAAEGKLSTSTSLPLWHLSRSELSCSVKKSCLLLRCLRWQADNRLGRNAVSATTAWTLIGQICHHHSVWIVSYRHTPKTIHDVRRMMMNIMHLWWWWRVAMMHRCLTMAPIMAIMLKPNPIQQPPL